MPLNILYKYRCKESICGILIIKNRDEEPEDEEAGRKKKTSQIFYSQRIFETF